MRRALWWLAIGVAVWLVYLHGRGYRVRFKNGVILALAPEMARALPAIDQAHFDAGITRGAFITSGTEGAHKTGSLHYAGRAVDLRTFDLTPGQLAQLFINLRRRLSQAYQIIDETQRPAAQGPHIHLEYDPA